MKTVGILPIGALGVSFFYHLTGRLQRMDETIFFLERAASKSSAELRASRAIQIQAGSQMHLLDPKAILKPDLLTTFQQGNLPDIVLVCPNPDQLLEILTSMVELLEHIAKAGLLKGDVFPFPIFVLCSNGIYFQRIRQIFVEKMEESILLGRLPELWPDLMPGIVGRLMRGVTIQTGIREGVGAEAVYHPGPRGITRLAGGHDLERRESVALLASKGGWFELAGASSPTRLEFDKGMINLCTNFLGQLYAIDRTGAFHPLTVREIVTPLHEPELRELARHVLAVGKAVKVYQPNEAFEAIFAELKQTCQMHADHIPSSLQWVSLRLRVGQLLPQITPTEAWLIEPLIRYARSAGLDQAARHFEQLKTRLIEKLRIAIDAYSKPSPKSNLLRSAFV